MMGTGEIGGSLYGDSRLPKGYSSLGTSSKEPSQVQIRDAPGSDQSVYGAPRPWKEKSSVAQLVLSPKIDCLKAPNNHCNPHSTDHLSLGPRPLRAIPPGHMQDSIISPLTSLDYGKGIFGSQSESKYENTGVRTNPHAKYWNNSSTHDTDTPVEYRSKPVRDNSVPEAATNISMSLCSVKNHKRVAEVLIPAIRYLTPKTEDESTSSSTNGRNRIRARRQALIKQEPAEDVHNVDRLQSQAIIPFKEASDKSASDRIRRARISEGIKALQNSVSCSNKGNRESVLDDVIDYIKFLKLQLKVLSQSRLCGEATPHPFVHLEGYGHYLFDHQMCNNPLEEVMGQLMETNMQAAYELLESKGLAVLPMDLAYTLLQLS